MQILITAAELIEAPEVVRNWFASRFQTADTPSEPPAEEPPKGRARKRRPKEESKPKEPSLTTDETRVKALEILKPLENRTEVLKGVLEKFDVEKISDLPEDKLADFLTELAVHG